jgi:uncharacterized protein
MEQSDLICVKKTKHKGLGVFARQPIPKGTVIERAPVLLVPLDQLADGKKNKFLNTYMYVWTKKAFAIALGYGSLYNHSFEPNAEYIFGPRRLTYRALKDIEKGEEITINYNYYPDNREPMGFDVK